jgi:bacterioferritin-associated ferredoxin
MIVCSCNLFTDADIRALLAKPNAPARVREVYGALGCAAKCGGCAGSINRILNEAADRKEDQAVVEQLDAA